MKEVISHALPTKTVELPDDILAKFRATQTAMQTRSTFLWGEHCRECGFPDCYATCSFYTPREDYHCKRFAEGLRSTKSADVLLNSVTFRMWGKLEAQGPVSIVSDTDARKADRRAKFLSKSLHASPLPPARKNSLSYRLNVALQAKNTFQDNQEAESFIVEAYLYGDADEDFTLSFWMDDKADPHFFQAGFTLTPGYNRHIFAKADIEALFDLSKPYRVQIEPLSEDGTSEILFGVIDFASLASETAAPSAAMPGKTDNSKAVKCVVWDLDHTVWDGTLAEDGIEGLKIRPEVVAMMHKLDARGILNSVASKNDEEAGLAALEHFGLRDLILYPQIGWHPKSQSLKAIAKSIDIGLDTFVFLDDQPFERGEVSETVPAVECLDAVEATSLFERARFDVPVTEEAAKRRQKYKDEEKRASTFSASGQDYLAFLESCNIKLTIMPLTPDHLDRAYELSQRTNQLNFSGKRYEKAELESMRADASAPDILLMQCEDRFGDYGIIGMCVLNRKLATIESFMMSCRVQRKMVEHAFFGHIGAELSRDAKKDLTIHFKSTERNQASVRMLEDLGFQAVTEAGQTIAFTQKTQDLARGQSVVAIIDKREKETL